MVATDEEAPELVPDLFGVLQLLELHVVGGDRVLAPAGTVLDNDDRDIPIHESGQHAGNVGLGLNLPISRSHALRQTAEA